MTGVLQKYLSLAESLTALQAYSLVKAVGSVTREGLWVFDESMNSLGLSARMREILGISPIEAWPDSLSKVCSVEHYEAFLKFAVGVCREPVRDMELTLRAKDGKEIDALVTIAKVEGEGIIAALFSDVTERRWFDEITRSQILLIQEYSQELEQKQIALLQANQRLEALAITDGLTELYNHRAFQEQLAQERARCIRSGSPLSLLLMDIDHFKKHNDTYGHPEGDSILRQVAATLKEQVRKGEFAARYGGEEFAVIMPFTDVGEAYLAAERYRSRIENAGWNAGGVTISAGTATLCEEESAAELIERADRALYHAKKEGRNRVAQNERLPQMSCLS